jgi:CBS domain-containing protein
VIFTLDAAGRFTGVISLQDLKHILSDPNELRHAYHIEDFKQAIVPIRVTQSLDVVVDRFADTGLDRLPVVDDENSLVGSVILSDIMRRYNQEVANRNIAIELGARIAAHDQSQTLHIGGDTIVTEIEVPKWMAGHKLGDLQLRSKYHVSVFIVKERREGRPPSFITPNADYCFRPGDLILISGTAKDIKALQSHV